eukprot:656515-Prymnesium_polylepis.1
MLPEAAVRAPGEAASWLESHVHMGVGGSRSPGGSLSRWQGRLWGGAPRFRSVGWCRPHADPQHNTMINVERPVTLSHSAPLTDNSRPVSLT